MSAYVLASHDALLAAGWKPVEKPLVHPHTYGATDRIVLENGPIVLVHTYSVGLDSSDYPGHDRPVAWVPAALVRVELWDVKFGGAS